MVKAETVLQGSANNIRVVVRNNTLCAEILYFEPELGARDWQKRHPLKEYYSTRRVVKWLSWWIFPSKPLLLGIFPEIIKCVGRLIYFA